MYGSTKMELVAHRLHIHCDTLSSLPISRDIVSVLPPPNWCIQCDDAGFKVEKHQSEQQDKPKTYEELHHENRCCYNLNSKDNNWYRWLESKVSMWERPEIVLKLWCLLKKHMHIFPSAAKGSAVSSRQRMATEWWLRHVIQYRTLEDRPPQALLLSFMLSVEQSLAMYGRYGKVVRVVIFLT